MVDRLSVRIYKVDVTPVGGAPRQKVIDRLEVMDREIRHLQLAVTNIKHAVQHALPQTHAALANAVMDLRNWMLSIVMSEAYVQYMFGANLDGNARPEFLAMLAQRAVRAGSDDAARDRSS